MEIRCATCTLRPLVPADAASLALHANDREVWINLRDAFPHPYSVRDAEEYIAAMPGSGQRGKFGIIVDGAAVGAIGLIPGSDIERISAEIGYWVAREFWGRGIATDAIRATTAYAFDELGIHRVFAVPFARNTASIRALEKAGYVREGLMRHSAIKAGEVVDQYLYAAYTDNRNGRNGVSEAGLRGA
jgi:RimJ/RimL family protein N-acetyltransferase